MKKIAIFPGSFDPFTKGHYSIVERALSFIDEIIIGVAVNSDKHTLFSTEKRVQMIQELYKDNSRITVEAFEGITTDFAKRKGAEFIIRGIRTSNDFEYEDTVAYVYRKISGIETIFLFTEPELVHISSTIVRELLHYHQDVSQFIPEGMKLD